MMTVKDAIMNVELTVPFTIEYRFVMQPDYESELFGFCQWDGNDLISLDGDSYSLGDEIEYYEIVETCFGNKQLSVTFLADTLTDEDLEKYQNEVYFGETPEETELYYEMCENAIVVTSKKRTRGERRNRDWKKALRKKRRSEYCDGVEYNNVHQYSKNKITSDSSYLWSAFGKTNLKKARGNGASCQRLFGSQIQNGKLRFSTGAPHWGDTNKRMGRHFSASDMRRYLKSEGCYCDYLNGLNTEPLEA